MHKCSRGTQQTQTNNNNDMAGAFQMLRFLYTTLASYGVLLTGAKYLHGWRPRGTGRSNKSLHLQGASPQHCLYADYTIYIPVNAATSRFHQASVTI